MENLFVLRGQVQEVYAERSKIIDKIIQFILAFAIFYFINKNVGFMKTAASPVVALGLALVCAFLPMIITVMGASALMMLHAYSVSLGVLLVMAITFLVMYIFYFRLTPKMSLVLVLAPLAFALKIPYVIVAAFALVGTPLSLVAIMSGTIVFYMVECMKTTASVIEGGGAKGMLPQVTLFAKQLFQNKEMWIVIAALVISFFVVYTLRRQSMDHAWKIAIAAGAVMNIVVVAVGDIALGVHTSYAALIVGSIVAVGLGLILELFFFAVDYARSELLQFEDDEYCYYVKAVPKVSVAIPEKTVKRINERQETEIIDTEAVRRKAGRTRGQLSSRNGDAPANAPQKRESKGKAPVKPAARKPAAKRGPAPKEHIMSNTEQILLNESLKRDLNTSNK